MRRQNAIAVYFWTACTRALVRASASLGVTCQELRGQPRVMRSIPPKHANTARLRVPFHPGTHTISILSSSLSNMCMHTLFQLYAAVTERIPPEDLGLVPGSPLLISLKQCVVELARSSNILSTVQEAAQSVLKSGWLLLLPTVSERASALSQLLPSGEGEK